MGPGTDNGWDNGWGVAVSGEEHPSRRAAGQSSVDLYWLPLGSGGRCVGTSGRLYEALIATRNRRRPMRLYHSALIVRLDGQSFTIEMTPCGRWPTQTVDRRRGASRHAVVGPLPALPLRDPVLARRQHSRPGGSC